MLGEDKRKICEVDNYKKDYYFENAYIQEENNEYILYLGIKYEKYFYIKLNNKMDDDDIKLIKSIINNFIKISMYSIDGKKQHDYN